MPTDKQRLQWLDALRGFTMILVVANHVATQGFLQESKLSASLPFLLLFRMPLFFFISGFLAYKVGLVWNARVLGNLSLKKLRVQIVPTVVFFILYKVLIQPDFCDAIMTGLHSPLKSGYWFTLVLLYMLLIYYVFSYIESKLRLPSWLPITILLVISLCCYETCYLPRTFSWAQGYKGSPNDFMCYSSIMELFRYFPFFLYGNIVHRYWSQAQRIMDSRWFFPLVIVLVIISTMDFMKWHMLRMEWTIIPLTMAKLCLLTIVFMYFRHYQDYFSKGTVIGSSLQYIGRRTLDIYLIHFFFIPNLPTIGTFFNEYKHNFVIDTTMSVVVALLIVGFSIITSNILRISPLFKKYLFGR